MALRKQLQVTLEQSIATAQIIPFVNGLDNGEVHITQGNQSVVLTYDDIAYLYGRIYPQKEYDCDGNEKPHSYAALSDEEREAMYERFPETRPHAESGQQMAALDAALVGVPEMGQ